MIVAVDIGGTKSRIAHLDYSQGKWALNNAKVFDSRKIDNILQPLQEFLNPQVVGVAIGIAGPVKNNSAKISNLDWGVDGPALETTLKIPVLLMNDLVAHASGLKHITFDKLSTLNKGEFSPGPMALIAAGTGLGESIIGWDGARNYPMSSEGGHCDFAPLQSADVEFWQFLHAKYGHVSWERVVSGGDGFNNLVAFHVSQKHPLVGDWQNTLKTNDFVASMVGESAEQGDKFAQFIIQEFLRFYGAAAGNLALKSMPTAGMFVGGGVINKIKKWISPENFLAAFLDKGRFANLLKTYPVHIIEDEDLALKGAAQYWQVNSGIPND